MTNYIVEGREVTVAEPPDFAVALPVPVADVAGIERRYRLARLFRDKNPELAARLAAEAHEMEDGY